MDIKKKLTPYGVPDELIKEIRELVVRDALTGLYNRRFFEEALKNLSEVADRYTQPLSLILIDLNDFKLINDQQGYTAGDKALQDFADLLLKTCRTADIVCRYGGDEFAVILPNTALPGAKQLTKRIHTALPQSLSASTGIAARPTENLFIAAETELRRQKQQ